MRQTEPTHRGAPLWRVLTLVAAVIGMLGLGTEQAAADHTVEHTFEVPPSGGGFPVTWDDGSPDGCTGTDSDIPPPAGEEFTIVHPSASSLGLLGDHPVVVFGAGTNTEYGDTASQRNSNCNPSYNHFLRLFASWGFVVVAYNDGQVGSGKEMLRATDLAILLNALDTPTNPFYDKLDTSSIATIGHSQGAVGAINAALSRPGQFESVVTLAMPDWSDLHLYNDTLCSVSGCDDVDPIPARKATNNLGIPIFFARASGLYLGSGHRCGDDDWMSDNTATDWYPDAPRRYQAGTVHVTPAEPAYLYLCDFGWPAATWPHIWTNDAAGYVTAWLAYTLQNQAQARPAFVGPNPELRESHPDWENVTSRGLT